MKLNQILSNSLLLLLLLPFSTLAQTEHELSLRQDFSNYFLTIQEKDIEKSMTYIYPKLFDQIPKEEIINAMQAMYNDPDIYIELTNSKLKSIDKMLFHEQGKYTKLEYSFLMQMSFAEEEEEGLSSADETPEEEELDFDFGSFMLEIFQAQYGKENVKYIAAQNRMEINFDSSMLAVYDPDYPDSWKFMENKKSLLSRMKTVLPKPVWKYWKKKR